MDIVDTQIHLFLTMGIEGGLAAMDALGIQAALIDEFWGYPSGSTHPSPGYELPGGVFRPLAPGAEMASLRHPDRFSYLLRVDHRDPDLDALIRQTAANPSARAIRVEARTEAEVQDLADGKYAAVFESAAQHQVPVSVLTFGNAPLLDSYAGRFSDAQIIIDHVGLPSTLAGYDDVLRLARHPNIALKWCHAAPVFDSREYPFESVMPQLRRALDAFGRERIMWASDFTAIRSGHRWGDMLFYIRESAALTLEDKEWILGRTARAILNWPAPQSPAQPEQHRH